MGVCFSSLRRGVMISLGVAWEEEGDVCVAAAEWSLHLDSLWELSTPEWSFWNIFAVLELGGVLELCLTLRVILMGGAALLALCTVLRSCLRLKLCLFRRFLHVLWSLSNSEISWNLQHCTKLDRLVRVKGSSWPLRQHFQETHLLAPAHFVSIYDTKCGFTICLTNPVSLHFERNI